MQKSGRTDGPRMSQPLSGITWSIRRRMLTRQSLPANCKAGAGERGPRIFPHPFPGLPFFWLCAPFPALLLCWVNGSVPYLIFPPPKFRAQITLDLSKFSKTFEHWKDAYGHQFFGILQKVTHKIENYPPNPKKKKKKIFLY